MLEVTLLGRIALAMLLCAVIGIEREFHGRPAGLRTHLLVGGGASLIMTMGVAYAEGALGFEGSRVSLDIARLVAGIVTGIGFLGAGTIIREGDWVRGLTTAASVWFVAGVGAATGLGMYALAAGATAIGFTVLFGISRLERRMPNLTRRTLILEVPADAGSGVQSEIDRICAEHRVRTRLLSWEANEAENIAVIRMLLTYWQGVNIVALAEEIQHAVGAISVEVNH